MENQPNYGRTPYVPYYTPAPPGIPEDLHREAQDAAWQAYYEVYNSLSNQNAYLQQQLYMQNSYNIPVEQIDDESCLEDPTIWSKEQFMNCITQQSGSKALQKVLKSESEAKERIIDFVDSLDIDEIVSLSQDKHGNFLMIAVIKYADKNTVKLFMRNLVENPSSIKRMCVDRKSSYRVIMSLIIFGKNLEKLFDEFVSVVKDTSNINLLIIQQLIEHVPGYKIRLLEEIQRGEFPPTKLSDGHLHFLGMYSWEEIEGCMTSERMNGKLKNLLKKKFWKEIHDNTTSKAYPEFLVNLDNI